MKSKTTKQFRRMLAELPKEVRQRARETYKLFKHNPNHPGLRLKRAHATDPIYSVRINIDYRALGILDGEEIVWFWIGPHTDYDKMLSKL